jgi:hypothetical protein
LIDGIYTGQARCYKLSPALTDPTTGEEHEYVSIVVQPGTPRHQLPEVLVFGAEPKFGGVNGRSMKKLPGSGTLYDQPTDPEHGWRYALIQLGVTEVTD